MAKKCHDDQIRYEKVQTFFIAGIDAHLLNKVIQVVSMSLEERLETLQHVSVKVETEVVVWTTLGRVFLLVRSKHSLQLLPGVLGPLKDRSLAQVLVT